MFSTSVMRTRRPEALNRQLPDDRCGNLKAQKIFSGSMAFESNQILWDECHHRNCRTDFAECRRTGHFYIW
jgi:hypothetical protein